MAPFSGCDLSGYDCAARCDLLLATASEHEKKKCRFKALSAEVTASGNPVPIAPITKRECRKKNRRARPGGRGRRDRSGRGCC